MTGTQVEFLISAVGHDRVKGSFCTITAPKIFRRPVAIYGDTAPQAGANARRFVQLVAHEVSAQRTVSAAVAGVLPVAVGAAASDGPLPVGDIVAGIMILGVATYALLSSRSNSRESECDALYEEDSAVCRSLRTRRDRAICWETAAERLAACLSRRPRPPLWTGN